MEPTERRVFVGRLAELARLGAILERALAGQGQVCFLSGEAGGGKSALLGEFARLAQARSPDLVVAVGECDAYTGAGDAYLPFREVLEQLAGGPGRGRAAAASGDNPNRLRRLLSFSTEILLELGPDLVDLFLPGSGLVMNLGKLLAGKTGVAERFKKSPEGERPAIPQEQIFEQYVNVLRSLSQKQPLLLILDDLHWVDPASAALLFRLARRLGECRILVAGSFRTDELALGRGSEPHPLEKVVHELRRYHGEIVIDLDETNARDGRAFVDAYLDSAANCLNDAFRQALYNQTGGQPLFTVELLRDLSERGSLVQDEHGCWAEGPGLDWTDLPARVEGVIDERIRRLPAAERQALAAASVEGNPFTGEAVARALRQEERQVVRMLSGDLQKVHALVKSLGQQRLQDQRLSRYGFSHHLVQAYLYAGLDEAERAYLHEDIAAALEALYAGQTAEIAVQLARHYELAGLPSRALPYLRQAGEQAAGRYANAEALEYFKRALALTPPGDHPARCDLLLACERVHDLLGDRAAQAGELAELAEIAGRLADPEKQAAIALRQAALAGKTGRGEQAVALARQAAAGLEALPEAAPARAHLQVEANLLLGRLYWQQSAYAEAGPPLEAALDLARRSGDRDGEIQARERLVALATSQGRHSQARDHYQAALELAEQGGDRRRKASLLNNLGVAARWLGDPEQAGKYYAQAVQTFHEIGDRMGEASTRANLGDLLLQSGAIAPARAEIEQALQIQVDIGSRRGEAVSLINLGEIAHRLASYTLAQDYALRALSVARQIGFRFGESAALGNLSQEANALGDFAQALDWGDQALEAARQIGDELGAGLAQANRGRALLELGRLDEARGSLLESIEILGRENDLDGLGDARRSLARLEQIQESAGPR